MAMGLGLQVSEVVRRVVRILIDKEVDVVPFLRTLRGRKNEATDG